MRTVRTAFKYFVYGLLVGLFFAPRRGDAARPWHASCSGGERQRPSMPRALPAVVEYSRSPEGDSPRGSIGIEERGVAWQTRVVIGTALPSWSV